jgi:hypothetical protein
VTQDHNTRVTENAVTHIDREAQSLVLTDFSDRSTWIMEFSDTLVFWSCVTLDFFNSAPSPLSPPEKTLPLMGIALLPATTNIIYSII